MKLMFRSFVRAVAGRPRNDENEYDLKNRYVARMEVFCWVLGLTMLAAFLWWSLSSSFVSQAAFTTAYIKPFNQAYLSSDPAQIATNLNQGLAGIRKIGYDRGHANLFMPPEPARDLAVLTKAYEEVAKRANELAQMDRNDPAYQFGLASLLDKEATWPGSYTAGPFAKSELTLYNAKFAREAGLQEVFIRSFEWALLASLLFGLLIWFTMYFTLEWLCGLKDYWDYEPGTSIERI